MKYLFYVVEVRKPPVKIIPTDDSAGLEMWKPFWRRILPPPAGIYPYLVWLLFHQLRIFRNQGYKVIFARDEKVVIHRTCTLPGYFRFPFMNHEEKRSSDIHLDPSGLSLKWFGAARTKKGHAFIGGIGPQSLVCRPAGECEFRRGGRKERICFHRAGPPNFVLRDQNPGPIQNGGSGDEFATEGAAIGGNLRAEGIRL
jgi:hypothetical protein